ncbi:MAG: hypothetical protein CMJ40_10795 [Phycisphaerae bacterium]|nr:hypothetical protein [Phycisphaerae bacterium]
MSLLTPWTGFFLLVGVVPPLLLMYFLKLRRRTLPISSTLLWFTSTEDLQANSPFQRLRRNLLLLLQLIVLLLLVLAVMQPRMEGRSGAGGRTVLLIDRSGSMTATDGDENGRSRLEIAKQLAREAVDRLHPGGLFSSGDGETMIVSFGEDADILQPFTDSRVQLLDAIDRIEVSHGRSFIEEALQLARVYSINTNPDDPDVPQLRPATLELFSDGQLQDLDAQVLRGETLTYHRIGSDRTRNMAVMQLAAERPWDRPASVEVFASIGNFRMERSTIDVQLSVDGQVRSIQELEVPAATSDGPGRRSLVFSPFELARGAVIEVALIGEDELAVDDSAVLVVPPQRKLNVVIVSDGRQLLPRILGGFGLEQVDFYTPQQWRERQSELKWDVVVFDNVSLDSIPGVPTLSIGRAPKTDLIRSYGLQRESQVALEAESRHPVMQHVDTGSLFVQETEALQPDGSVDVLLSGTRNPLVMSWEEGRVPNVHVAFDPVQSNWPYEPGFVAFLYNTIDWLGHSNAAVVEGQSDLGEMIRFIVPGGLEAVTLRRPDGSARNLLVDSDGMAGWGPLMLSGLHVLEVEDSIGSVQYRSVRFPAEQESAIAAVDSIILGQEQIEATDGGARGYVPLWPWAIGAALIMLMCEWWIWNARVGGQRPSMIMQRSQSS